jgi:hypothetical protein
MRPKIDGTSFGSITVAGTVFDHDIVISPHGDVSKRKKKLSKAIYGTSHVISLEEARYIAAEAAGVDRVIIGAGQHGMVQLSPEAAEFFAGKGCAIVLRPTPEVIKVWTRRRAARSGYSTSRASKSSDRGLAAPERQLVQDHHRRGRRTLAGRAPKDGPSARSAPHDDRCGTLSR